jgi:hypothetical protein
MTLVDRAKTANLPLPGKKSVSRRERGGTYTKKGTNRFIWLLTEFHKMNSVKVPTLRIRRDASKVYYTPKAPDRSLSPKARLIRKYCRMIVLGRSTLRILDPDISSGSLGHVNHGWYTRTKQKDTMRFYIQRILNLLAHSGRLRPYASTTGSSGCLGTCALAHDSPLRGGASSEELSLLPQMAVVRYGLLSWNPAMDS